MTARQPPLSARRRRFHRRVYLGILHEQRLICACGCNVKFTRAEGYQFDHDTSLGLGGTDTPEDLRALRTPCHAKKTRIEAAVRAKADRQRKAFLGLKKRRGRPMQSRPFRPSRGFDTRVRRKVDGTVEVRL